MNKIDQIKHAIHEANLFRSKLTPEALAVPGFTSLKIRHLMNNLGAISRNYLEIGSHKGSTLCSALFQNETLTHATAVDNFSEFADGNPMQELLSNVGRFKPGHVKFKLITKDCWTINTLPWGIDLYLFDGQHDYDSQRKAVTHFLPFMADEFILCVDDYDLEQVKTGTAQGISDIMGEPYKEGYKVSFDQYLPSTPEIPNESWHQGFYVALVKKNT